LKAGDLKRAGDARPLPQDAKAPDAGTLMIRSPIRSGQLIFHPHGDVIVLGSVASGSEIVATGSIHVYGTLRGRASAGAQGNTAARVFCRRNEAELLSVDGWYCTAEEMDPSVRGKPVQAFLDNGMLRIAPFS
jgi:septum site-determining protein MinC